MIAYFNAMSRFRVPKSISNFASFCLLKIVVISSIAWIISERINNYIGSPKTATMSRPAFSIFAQASMHCLLTHSKICKLPFMR